MSGLPEPGRLARLQQVSTLGLLALAFAWAISFLHAGWPLLAAAGALLILLGYALFLAGEFVLLQRQQRGDPAPRAGIVQLLGAWWGEVMTAPIVFCWRQPFRSQAVPDHLPDAAAGRRGVLFVHGFVCNRGFWNPWISRLRGLGVPALAIDLEPVFGSLDAYPDQIDSAVRRLEVATGLPPVIVAHSMGGLAVRAWLARFRSDRRVHRVITIGSPHHGTWLARFSFSRNGRQMRRQSGWLSRLAGSETARRRALFTCFYSNCDNIVFPVTSATLPGADNRFLPGWAHVHLAFQPEVFSELLRWVGPSAPDA